jgi:hypothetical protein
VARRRVDWRETLGCSVASKLAPTQPDYFFLAAFLAAVFLRAGALRVAFLTALTAFFAVRLKA